MVAAAVLDFYMDTIKVPHYIHKNYAFFVHTVFEMA